VDWSERHQEGFALAAAANHDARAALGAVGLCPEAVSRATTVANRLWDGERSLRHAWLRRMLAPDVRVDAAPPGCPPRVLGLLAGDADKELGRRWLGLAPLPRAGYVPDPRLLTLLRRLVQPRQSGAR